MTEVTLRHVPAESTPKQAGRWIRALLIVLALPLLVAACGGSAAEEPATAPAVTEKVKGSDVIRVKLTAEAAERLGVETVAVRRDGDRTVIPYEAVLYDPDGATWTYTSPSPSVYQRENIVVARVDGGSAVLTRGPPVGIQVVTAGATEIWGVEYGGIEED